MDRQEKTEHIYYLNKCNNHSRVVPICGPNYGQVTATLAEQLRSLVFTNYSDN